MFISNKMSSLLTIASFIHYLCILFGFCNRMEYAIETTWDNKAISHSPVTFKFSAYNENNLLIEVTAPFFDSPAKPSQKPGDDFNLWDYEGFLILTIVSLDAF